ncbi:aspartate/glutamate racemase family protein [Paenibacillus hamazuiensis]|uniref:aspartate/glutamate racemase family protein n=1 Tax=Paenibacillus hamazuiensis TaxID=2936508 RepID=UPI00200F0A3B|nr:aspartate/glutamate racemase family protein [Paenibacillus hamazuiensis]
MKTVVAVYTGQGLADPLKSIFNEVMPDCRLVNIIDDGLIHDVNREGAVTKAIVRRLVGYYRQAADMGADVILNTCSSVGEVVDIARPMFDVPIVKIDESMAGEAVRRYGSIGVIATLRSTLAPTVRLIRMQASAQGRAVSVTEGLADGAYQALIGGKPEEHDRLIAEAAEKAAASCDALVLAQGSMARMEQALAERTGKPVLSSPRLGLMAVKAALGRGGA